MKPEEVLVVLAEIDAGRITITADCDPEEQYCGTVRCTASNGWTFGVFNDCGGWDYIEWVEYPETVIVGAVAQPTWRRVDPWAFLDSPAFKAACRAEHSDDYDTRHEAIEAVSQPEWAEVRSYFPADPSAWGWKEKR